MEESEPTLSTDPSSSAIRARAFTWVFTRSCQFTAVFAAAVIVFPLRAMFTAGITRDTSPARCPAACGSAQILEGIATKQERNTATPRTHGDFFFILDSPKDTKAISCCYWRSGNVSIPAEKLLSSLYMAARAHHAGWTGERIHVVS